jgi:Spy/CpxP family protein refolding chaperone
MKIQTKFALFLLAAAISLPAALAQAPDQAPGPDTPAGPAMRQPMPFGGWHMRGVQGPREGRRDRGRGMGMGMGMGMYGRGGQDFMLGRIIHDPAVRERLGITAEQTTKIEQETSAFRKTQIRNRADVEIKGVELRDLLAADQPNRAAIDKKLEEISAARLTQQKAAVGFYLTIRNVLTPDQRQKLQEMRWGSGAPGPRRGRSRGPGNPPTPPARPAPPAPPGQN